MKRDFETLKRKYETWLKVSKKLGISYRRLCQVRAGAKPGSSLETLIRLYARQIREMEE